MAINWPSSLVQELASKRSIIFIGAGLSAGCTSIRVPDKRPPDWKQLLIQAAGRLKAHEADYINQLIGNEKLLDAAEIIFHNANQGDKRNFFVEAFATPDFEPSKCHEAIQGINPKIVITTNYDQIYEKQCDALLAGRGYSVRKFSDTDLLDCVRSKDNLIIKAHGCISTPGNLIITRSDYYNIKKINAAFYSILDSLLTVNTVLFIGCSMTDPDIQLILENTSISVPSTHTHYAVMPAGTHAALRAAMENAYNIKILEYQNDDHSHSKLLEGLCDLKTLVEEEKATAIN